MQPNCNSNTSSLILTWTKKQKAEGRKQKAFMMKTQLGSVLTAYCLLPSAFCLLIWSCYGFRFERARRVGGGGECGDRVCGGARVGARRGACVFVRAR